MYNYRPEKKSEIAQTAQMEHFINSNTIKSQTKINDNRDMLHDSKTQHILFTNC